MSKEHVCTYACADTDCEHVVGPEAAETRLAEVERERDENGNAATNLAVLASDRLSRAESAEQLLSEMAMVMRRLKRLPCISSPIEEDPTIKHQCVGCDLRALLAKYDAR